MGGAVVVEAGGLGEEFGAGGANVGAVEEDYSVEPCHCHVHGGDSGVSDEGLPHAG